MKPTIALLLATAALRCFAQDSSGLALVQHLASRQLLIAGEAPSVALAPPPTISPDEADFLLTLQAKRTTEDALITARENTAAVSDLLALAGCEKKPYTKSLTYLVTADATTLSCRELLAYHFPSPTEYSHALQAIIPTGGMYGYPSAHAVALHAALCVLEEIAGHNLPDCREYVARVEQRRVKGGVEWPSAIRSAPSLAQQYVALMRNANLFRDWEKLAAQEWR